MTNNTADAEHEVADADTTEDNSHLKKAIAARDKAKHEAREMRSQIEELQSRLQEFEQMKMDRAEQEALAEKDYQRAKEQYEKKLKERDSQINELIASIEERDRRDREGALLDGLHQRLGVDRDMAEMLYLKAQKEGLLSLPEELDGDFLAEASKTLSKRFNSLLTPKNSAPKKQPAFNRNTKAPGEGPDEDMVERVIRTAQAMSHGGARAT